MDDPESIIERFDAGAHDAINQPNRVLVNIYAELESTNEAVADALHEAKLARKAAEEARKASMMTIALNVAAIVSTIFTVLGVLLQIWSITP
jgi:hypothetical protein